jgi:hypothetical protein
LAASWNSAAERARASAIDENEAAGRNVVAGAPPGCAFVTSDMVTIAAATPPASAAAIIRIEVRITTPP